METYQNRPLAGLPIHVLETQVEDQRGYAVEEGQHPDGDKELCRRRVVTNKELLSGAILTVRDYVRMLHQSKKQEHSY